MQSFKYVNSQSTPGEKTMKLRTQILQNREGEMINGRKLRAPSGNILARAKSTKFNSNKDRRLSEA